ncbi:hypothetical protein LTR86_005095 [Recurvomyces mirabilis]|nr:hypothetical protein LTR86_005095 [Recurvomyces mirabilis]
MTSQNLDLSQVEMDAAMPSQESQGIEIPNVQKKLEQHKLRLKQRRKQRNEAIAQGHRARVEKLKADYESASSRHAEAIRAIRRPQANYLLNLVRRKRQLVTELESCLARLQIAFSATADKIQLAVDARLAALSEQF